MGAAATAAVASGARLGAAGAFGAGEGAAGAFAGAGVTAAPLPEITATTAPTGATSPAATRTSARMPASVAGTSIDTLSVSISNRLSPGATLSPADLNHFVILPSATVSPSCGIRTSMGLFDPLPRDLLRAVRRTQDESIADEFVAAHEVGHAVGLHAALTMMRDRAAALVERIGAEIGDVVGERRFRLVGRRLAARHLELAVGRDLRRHVAARRVEDDTLRVRAAARPRLAVDRRADIAPGPDDALRIALRAGLAARAAQAERRGRDRGAQDGGRSAHCVSPERLTRSARRIASP